MNLSKEFEAQYAVPGSVSYEECADVYIWELAVDPAVNSAYKEFCRGYQVKDIDLQAKYEAVCAELEGAQNEIERLRIGLIDLYSVACCCDGWDSFPSESLDKAARTLDGVKPPEAE